MDVWMIRFLGVPCAYCNGQQAHLRSKETWAVLASLVLPATLQGEVPLRLARTTLADRFWTDEQTVEPRTHLRQCLTSLRKAFGETCLLADRQDVQLASGWFTTDLDHIFTAYRRALVAASAEERLHWLLEAEKEIRGEFFEGWTARSDEAEIWLTLARADVCSRLVSLLLLLAQTLQITGNPTAAFDIARRALLFQPGSIPARQIALELAVSTGQQDVLRALKKVHSFQEALNNFSEQGMNTLSLKDGRVIQSLFEAELAMLAPGLKKAVLSLSIFPAPFPDEMAAAVCSVSSPALQLLMKTPFLQQEADTFFLPPLVCDCAQKRLSAPRHRQLRKRLALFCMQTIGAFGLPLASLPAPLESVDIARPFLLQTLNWILEQHPTEPYVWFINMLRYRGLNDVALMGIPYFRKIQSDASFPVEMRLNVGLMTAYILMQADEDAAAIAPLEIVLALAEANPEPKWFAAIYPTLMRAYSNTGDWEAARRRGLQALTSCRLMKDSKGERHCIRFLAEIALNAGEPERALLLCEEAQLLGEILPADPEYLPDALYMKAHILYHLQRWEEASDAIETALARWQESGDTKVGLCLWVMGLIHLEIGRHAEARMHLEHAIHLHRRGAREGHRLAAVEALGDVFSTMNRHSDARALYEECLAYYNAKSHLPGAARLQKKLEI